ncbi:MAG: hypothetical protein KKH41_01035 [Candidatus Thermoplasmatota archaeon]|nr:hypothetical protein [Euryarchaeota archaeon]MBU4031826.1 hypothetical protein [Candidatus Thermoplasmatota archaeon]MBU4071066.1 hypothetical protein [Candidatus Thermoplasmatota archaeon]MBU4145195.1 hypothetical protein [Candidatus Thermoplasmatota archaeon]MBU4591146.1 hypothetical protein [Candidatus Thermoplasmatota archaeon]
MDDDERVKLFVKYIISGIAIKQNIIHFILSIFISLFAVFVTITIFILTKSETQINLELKLIFLLILIVLYLSTTSFLFKIMARQQGSRNEWRNLAMNILRGKITSPEIIDKQLQITETKYLGKYVHYEEKAKTYVENEIK